MKRIISFITTFAMIMTLFAGIGSVSADNEGTINGKVIDYIELGTYPQTEIVGDIHQSGVYGKVWETDGDYEVDEELYATLQEEDGWTDNDKTVSGTKYCRITKSNSVSSEDGTGKYNWSNGDTYHYFRYDPIKWRILKVSGNDAFVLSEVALDIQKYDKNARYVSTLWDNCTVRPWLNDTFMNRAFTSDEQGAIVLSELKRSRNTVYGVSLGGDTQDKLFLLSFEECYGDDAVQYGFASSIDAADKARQVKSSTYAKAMGVTSYDDISSDYVGTCIWWLRTLGKDTRYAACINFDGSVDAAGYNVGENNYAVCPAMHLEIDKLTDEQIVFSDEPLEITADDVDLDYSLSNYAEPKVSIPGLIEGEDYEFTYADNTGIGTAKVILTGKGLYSGTVTKEYLISQADLDAKACYESGDIADYGHYNDVKWWLNKSDGTLTIYGIGKLDYSDWVDNNSGKAPLWDKCETVKHLVVTDKVSEVCNLVEPDADSYYINLETAVIEGSMTGLPYNSHSARMFDKCSKLETVTLGETVETIYDEALKGCKNLKTVDISEGLVEIGSRAFYECENLAGIELPQGLKTIGESAFEQCFEFDEVEIPESIESVGVNAFKHCGILESASVPYSIYSEDIFTETHIRNLTLTGREDISDMKATLKTTSYTYTGKAKCPAVSIEGLTEGEDFTVKYSSNTKCGKAKATITGEGKYTGTITKYFRIVPAKAVLSKATAGSKKITVSIKSQKTSGVTGYQIYYKKAGASAKTVTTTSTSKALTGLSKGKKYTVKVRAYKTIDGKKYYGAYSASKTVTVK